MFCPKCGQQNADGSAFCTRCGASLKVAGASVATTPGATAPANGSAPAMRPDMTQAMPVVAPAPQKSKSKTPVIVAIACAAVVLIGGGTVFALTMMDGSNNSSGTQISKVETGSSDEKAVSKKSVDKKKSSNANGSSLSNEGKDTYENESFYYADPKAGSADADASLSQVHTWKSDRNDYSMSIPDRFQVTNVPGNNAGITYTDPDTGFVISLSSYYNANDESASELLDSAGTAGKDDLYTAKDADWYVVSWRDGDTIYYEKTIVSSTAIATASLQYSTSNRDMGSQLIDSLLPTLKFE